MWDGEPMTAEREYEIRCETFGAQPSATVSWWINGDIRLKDCKTEVKMIQKKKKQIRYCSTESPKHTLKVHDDREV
jgi:hypothetical protein